MNRRQLGLGAAVSAFASATGLAARAQTRDPSAVAFYDSFNDQLARLPATIQPDVRTFYELNGWRPVWTPERLRLLRTAASRS
ncbi:MAG: peptidoglycan-binding protein, partial [Alphaproteobacteria bacterium]|nr:peptidoglycan-binding protein [Brevundimonas sp.]MBU3972709.1 peptidoglycan-binding protein [Alphaproteobacteria bacterium]